jgi:hypothetical protein
MRLEEEILIDQIGCVCTGTGPLLNIGLFSRGGDRQALYQKLYRDRQKIVVGLLASGFPDWPHLGLSLDHQITYKCHLLMQRLKELANNNSLSGMTEWPMMRKLLGRVSPKSHESFVMQWRWIRPLLEKDGYCVDQRGFQGSQYAAWSIQPL